MAKGNMAKMSRSNVKARRWMEENNFKNIHFFPHTRWSKDVHIDDLDFDGLATSDNKIVFFQCKSNCRATKKTLAKYKAAGERFKIRCLWINAVDRKPLEINNIPWQP